MLKSLATRFTIHFMHVHTLYCSGSQSEVQALGYLRGVPNEPLQVCNSLSAQICANGPTNVHLVPLLRFQCYGP